MSSTHALSEARAWYVLCHDGGGVREYFTDPDVCEASWCRTQRHAQRYTKEAVRIAAKAFGGKPVRLVPTHPIGTASEGEGR